MEEGAKYFPSESVIKKSISSQIYSRGNKYYQEKKKIREMFILSLYAEWKLKEIDTNARWDWKVDSPFERSRITFLLKAHKY